MQEWREVFETIRTHLDLKEVVYQLDAIKTIKKVSS